VLAEQQPRPRRQVGDQQHARALRFRLVGEAAGDQLDQALRRHRGGQLGGGAGVLGELPHRGAFAGGEGLLVPAAQHGQQPPPGLRRVER
jgi:hypothetical protein